MRQVGSIVTAPTCGSCGIVPAVLYHLQKSREFSDTRILRALATAGLIGNIVKTNASISGAEAGCQAEVGVACSMASAAANQLFGGSPAQIEYAAEMGLEHHLGMTCDPVCGWYKSRASNVMPTPPHVPGCQPLLLLHRWHAPRIIRQGGGSHERNRKRPALPLQRNQRRRTGEGL